ncbi:hypothetical protein [Streptomyces sp. NPDC006785]|uniref:hypothetical protein n=1 Tax=Streptomyces sp. NPDC006785 TaxID=3155461 RepID=UPI0033FD1AA2
MQAESLTTAQWWLVAAATSALLLAAVHYTFRNGKATLLSLIAPAAGAVAVLGASGLRGHGEMEALVMFSASMLAVALLVLALKPELPRMKAAARAGETYEAPKWKTGLYGVLTVAFAVTVAFVLL